MACNDDIYVTAAFKLVKKDQAMIFMQREYVIDDYQPNTKNDTILSGPYLIGYGFSSLKDTVFDKKGIDCAFASALNAGVSHIFSGNQCAKWFCDPETGINKILDGPKAIADMFPFFKGTKFESGVDAAFESTIAVEAYLFKGDEYAHIYYDAQAQPHLYGIYSIPDKWPCLKNTIFEHDIGAAFASHELNKAYLFKGEDYGKIKFDPYDTTKSKILWSGKIKDSWSELGSILPRHNTNLVAN